MGITSFTCKCGKVRKVPNAARHEVTRCDDCQIEYKRRKARERYRRRKGLSLDYVPPARTKKKAASVTKSSWLDLKIDSPPPPPKPELSPEEQTKHDSKMKSLFALIDDSSTDDDW